MANRTIATDDEVLKRATEQGTSANGVVRDYLEQYAGSRSVQEQALERLLPLFQHRAVAPRTAHVDAMSSTSDEGLLRYPSFKVRAGQ